MATLTGATITRKAADETVNNSATLQDDDDLVIAIGANETWYFEAMILHNTGTTPDIKVGFDIPAAATLSWTDVARTSSDTPAMTVPIQTDDGVDVLTGTGAASVAMIWGVVVNGANAGNLQFRWAQNTQDASDTKVLATSYLMAAREA